MDTTTTHTGDTLAKDSKDAPEAQPKEGGRAEKEAEVAHILCGMQLTTGSKPESLSSEDGPGKDTTSSTVSITALKNSSDADGARSDTANIDPVGSIDPTSACINRFPVVPNSALRFNRASLTNNVEGKAPDGTNKTFFPSMPPLIPASGQQVKPVDRRGFFNNFSNIHANIPSSGSGVPDGDSKKPLMALGSAKVTDSDVLLGRGGMTNKHPGNIRFRALVDSLKPSYLSLGSSKKKKKQFSEALMHKVMEYGGRFLVCHQGKIGMWTQADLATARKKCSQALREGKIAQASAQTLTSMPGLPIPGLIALPNPSVEPLAKSGDSSNNVVPIKKEYPDCGIEIDDGSQVQMESGNIDTSQSRKRKFSTEDLSQNAYGNGNDNDNDNDSETDHTSNPAKISRMNQTPIIQKAFGQALVESAMMQKVVKNTTNSESIETAGASPQKIGNNQGVSTQTKPDENAGVKATLLEGSRSDDVSVNKPYSEIIQGTKKESQTSHNKPYSAIIQGDKQELMTLLPKKAFGQEIVESASKLVAGNSLTQVAPSVIPASTHIAKVTEQKSLKNLEKDKNSAHIPQVVPQVPRSQPNISNPDSQNESNPSSQHTGIDVAPSIEQKDPSVDNKQTPEVGAYTRIVSNHQKNALSPDVGAYTRIVSQRLPLVCNNLDQIQAQLQATSNHAQNHNVVSANMNANTTVMLHQQGSNTAAYSGVNMIPPPAPAPQKNISVTPTENDVLLGRGGFTNKHSGNIRFREIVSKEKERYTRLGNSKKEKKRFSEHIVNAVHSYGGKFLVKEDNNRNNDWIIADPKAARKKCSQALRE